MSDFDDDLSHLQGLHLIQESDSAKHLLAYGLRTLRLAAFHDTTRDPVMTMLSIGVEKLQKVALGLLHVAEHRVWLPRRTLQYEYGHDLVSMESGLREAIRAKANRATHRPLVDQLLAAVDADPVWPPLVSALDRYGRAGRFYYLDALADSPQQEESPQAFWDRVDRAAVDADPDLTQLFHDTMTDFSLSDEFNKKLNARAADSLQQWWDLVAVAGVQGVLGDRGKGWGHDIRTVGRQVIESD